ncbi:MAG: PQQ-binding-like beta-propeller repeat protein, partial [Nitrospiraceae bacterium]|nr:PQQ-binding-like beta-propeller repeat protein [Nitrospiraceae bacterium]
MFWNVSGTYNKPSPLWTYHEKDTFSMWYYTIGNLNVCKDVIYAGGDRLTAINLKTGKELWETQLKNSSPRENANTFILYPTIYGDKIVAIGARLVVEKGFDYYFERRNVLVFERKTGKLLWKSTDIGAKLEYFDFGYPVILNNKIYIPALNGEYRASEYGYGSDLACKDEERGIWVWDLNTGKILRKIILPIPNGDLDIYGTSIRSYGTNIYITAGTSTGPLYLIAFDTLRNKVLWQTQVTDEMG